MRKNIIELSLTASLFLTGCATGIDHFPNSEKTKIQISNLSENFVLKPIVFLDGISCTKPKRLASNVLNTGTRINAALPTDRISTIYIRDEAFSFWAKPNHAYSLTIQAKIDGGKLMLVDESAEENYRVPVKKRRGRTPWPHSDEPYCVAKLTPAELKHLKS